MEIDFDEALIIRCKLTNDELQDLVSGEVIVISLEKNLQLELMHSPTLNYGKKPPLNGDHENENL